jgi:hypothetical protein
MKLTASKAHLLYAGFLPDLLFDPEDGTDISSETSTEFRRITRRYFSQDIIPQCMYRMYWRI